MKLNLIYFSAAGTTKKIVEAIAGGVVRSLGEIEIVDYPLIKMDAEGAILSNDDIAIFAIPVYAGRVPAIAAEQSRRFKGDGTRAIIVAVYGNREFDDALLELSDIVTENGFTPVAAGAFVAEHSIFPKVAEGRPSQSDLQMAEDLGVNAVRIEPNTATLVIPGNRPYKTPGSIPIAPKTKKSKCLKSIKKDKDACGICITACPVGAINSPKPSTNSDICIKCAHCIAVCPNDARVWGGLIYKLAEKKFVANYSTPKVAKLFYKQ